MTRRWIPLAYPLPNREWFQTENGWASREWTPETRAAAEAERGRWEGVEDEE